MSAQQAAWDDLPRGVQQCILVLTRNPCARRVSKAWRNAFDAANDTLRFSHVFVQSLEVVATAAATRVVKNSASLTAINMSVVERCSTPHPVMLSDLLAAGVTSGLATRLRKLIGLKVTAACAVQQLQALRQCTGLTHLDISGSDLQDCLAEELTAALQAMPRLTRLHMCSCELQSQHVVAALASALQPLTQLQHLHLAGSRLGETGLAALAPALSTMREVQTLDVCNTLRSAAGGTKALCTVLGVVPGLTHLDASYSCLREDGAALLAAVVMGMTRLQTLNVCSSDMGDRGVALLAPALAALPNLHSLDLSGNRLSANAVCMLQPVLARKGRPLRELNLSWNAFRGADAQSWASGLSTETQLQGLSLEQTRLGDEGWVGLAPSISRLAPSLQSLKLAFERLGVAGTAALASALKTLTGLTCLRAVGVFTSEAMVTIAPALMRLQRLQALNLSSTPMGAEGTAAFAAVLPALSGSLKQLTLIDCSLDAAAAANALAPALAQATGLAELTLCCNYLGTQGAQWLVPVLSAQPHLRKLDMQSCKLGVQGCTAIARALKDRDGARVDLRFNDVAVGSAEGVELCSMPGISVFL